MKLYLDIDGVLADFVGHFFKYLDLPDHAPTEWDDTRIRTHFHKIEQDKDFWLSIPPLVKTIPFEPYAYITTRPIYNDVSVHWLAANGFPFAPCMTTQSPYTKAHYMHEDGILIDDAAHNFKEVVHAGKRCLLLNTTYNQHVNTLDRIHSLDDVLTHLQATVAKI